MVAALFGNAVSLWLFLTGGVDVVERAHRADVALVAAGLVGAVFPVYS